MIPTWTSIRNSRHRRTTHCAWSCGRATRACRSRLLDADQGIAPTAWQASLFPPTLRAKIAVLHEGIDTDLICPARDAQVGLESAGLQLRPGDEVVTFVSRDLEPYRGYHIFMRALPRILERRPNARAVIVGGDKVSYGPAPPAGKSWKGIFF